MTRNEMETIYHMPEKEKDKYLERFTPQERADYRAFETALNKGRTKKKIAWWQYALVWLAIILVVEIIEAFILRADVKGDLEDQVAQIFKEHACVHGICIDGQWFNTVDAAVDYIVDEYGHLKFYVVYTSYGIDQYQYTYHQNGL